MDTNLVDTAPGDIAPEDIAPVGTVLLGRGLLDKESERGPQRLPAGPGEQDEGFGSMGTPWRDYMSAEYPRSGNPRGFRRRNRHTRHLSIGQKSGSRLVKRSARGISRHA